MSKGESLKGSAAVFGRFLNSPTTSGAGGRSRFGEGRLEPSYSVWADGLSKFQTSSEGVQALWILCLTVTALGLIAGTTRVLVAFAGIFQRRERAGRVGVPVEPRVVTLLPEREPVPPALITRRKRRRGWRSPDQVRP